MKILYHYYNNKKSNLFIPEEFTKTVKTPENKEKPLQNLQKK